MFLPLLLAASSLTTGHLSYDNGFPAEQILPDAGPRVDDGVDLFLTADFLYWTAREEGLGISTSGFTNFFNEPPSKGSVIYPDFGFDPGFKVGLGFSMGRDGWDMFLQYTWLHTNAGTSTQKADVSAFSTIGPRWFIGNEYVISDRLTLSKGNWENQLHALDLEWGRNFFVSTFLKIRPFIGMKGAFEDQDYKVRYEDDAAGARVGKMKVDQDYWGFGLRTGFNTAWQFLRSWAIYGDVALSALWGQFESERKDTIQEDPEPELVFFHTENSFHTVNPIIEMGMGVRYDLWFSNDRYHFMAQVGWEEQIWMSFNQYFRFFETGPLGDLIFQGLTVKLRFDF